MFYDWSLSLLISIPLDKESDIDRGVMFFSSFAYEVPFDSNEEVDGIDGPIYYHIYWSFKFEFNFSYVLYSDIS